MSRPAQRGRRVPVVGPRRAGFRTAAARALIFARTSAAPLPRCRGSSCAAHRLADSRSHGWVMPVKSSLPGMAEDRQVPGVLGLLAVRVGQRPADVAGQRAQQRPDVLAGDRPASQSPIEATCWRPAPGRPPAGHVGGLGSVRGCAARARTAPARPPAAAGRAGSPARLRRPAARPAASARRPDPGRPWAARHRW